jgi:hypothetical protein
MSMNPFDNLPDWTVAQNGLKKHSPAETVFEDHVVYYLLKHYGLEKTRAKFMIRDYPSDCCSADSIRSKSLTLYNFKRLFPDYPITLSMKTLHATQTRRLKPAAFDSGIEG